MVFSAIGGICIGYTVKDSFAEDVNLLHISFFSSVFIFILTVVNVFKDFRVDNINQIASRKANGKLRSINDEHQQIQNKIKEQERKKKYKDKVEKSGIEVIDTMSGKEFEDRLYLLFIELGYAVSKTPATGDQGADLIISKGKKDAVIQEKRYSRKRKVNNKAVQEALAGKYYYKTTDCWVVTNTDFTESAKKISQESGCYTI